MESSMGVLSNNVKDDLSDIYKRFGKEAFEKGDVIVNKAMGYYSRVKFIKNTVTGELYYDKEYSYILSLMKFDEAKSKKIGMKHENKIDGLFYGASNVAVLRDFVPLFERLNIDVNDFAKRLKKSTSAEKVVDVLLKSVYPYKVPGFFVNHMLNNGVGVSGGRSAFNGFIELDELKLGRSGYGINWSSSAVVLHNKIDTWIDLVGNGDSFYKKLGKYFFKRGECHYFLNSPDNFSVGRAAVYAIAYAYCGNKSMALKVSSIEDLCSSIEELLLSLNVFVLNYNDIRDCNISLSDLKYYYNLNPFVSEYNTLSFAKLKFLFDVVRLLSTKVTDISLGEASEIYDYLIGDVWNDLERSYHEILNGRGGGRNQNMVLSKKSFMSVEDLDRLYGFNTSRIKAKMSGVDSVYPHFPYFNLLSSGWTLEKLKKGVKAWHYRLARDGVFDNASWEGFPVDDYSVEILDKDGGFVEKVVYVEQIKTSGRLNEEGRKMRHCVVSHFENCKSGNMAIFSMHSKNYYGVNKRLLTIRVNKNFVVVEARGVANRDMKDIEYKYLREFVSFAGLTISPNVRLS